MAKTGGLGDQFFIGGYDLSGDVASIDTLGSPVDTIDTTTIKQLGHSRIYSLRNGIMSFTSFFENSVAVSTPGVPLTGVPVVSTVNQLVYVNITGGTVTNVTINGVTVGASLGLYQLPALGTITVAFTGVLVWSWFSLGAEHNALAPRITTDQIATYFRGSAIGNDSACCNCLQTNYDPTRDNTGNLTLKVDVTGDKFGLEWGKQLTAGIRSDSAATNGAALDSGIVGGTAFGAQAYLQLFSLTGTNVDVIVQHSPDNSAWSPLIDFASQTVAPFAARGSVSNVTTVNRFLRVVTTGTFSLALFAVMVNRNPVAGVVF